ncbi:MAG: histidinol-phosphatase [Gammaproteobacteria bacterium]|nr:histidinol-phosphatase [Gammaproteobacteria bacterium]
MLSATEARGLLAFATSLSDEARRIVHGLAPDRLDVTVKADGSYVSAADTAIEAAWRDRIRQRFPDHGLIGEEYAATGAGSVWQWVLDPIDGTDNFVHGLPTFGTLVSLRHEGEAILGVIDHPALDVRFAGARGLGVTRNGRPVTVSSRREAVPIIAVTAPENFAAAGRFDLFCHLAGRFPNLRIYRDCFAHGLVLQGAVTAAVDFHVRLWDISAAEALVPEAGGLFVRLDDGGDRQQVAFGQRQAVEAIVAVARKPQSPDGAD